jgi:hypothetical protein
VGHWAATPCASRTLTERKTDRASADDSWASLLEEALGQPTQSRAGRSVGRNESPDITSAAADQRWQENEDSQQILTTFAALTDVARFAITRSKSDFFVYQVELDSVPTMCLSFTAPVMQQRTE